MAVYDRWHLSHPPEGAEPCKCGRGRNKLYPSADHGTARRWQVRWRDESGRQRKKNFTEKVGDDPERHAAACDAKVNAELDADSWIDPELGKITLEAYAKQWRGGLASDPASLETVDKHLAHIYDVERTDRTKRAPGSSPIGHREMRALAKSPSAIQQWVKSLEAKGLAPGYVKAITTTLSTIFAAAIEDGRISRNPVRSKSVRLPTVPDRKVRPWTLEMVQAARAEVDRRHSSGAMVDLAAAAGLRESEVFAFAEEDIVFLGADRKILVRRQIKRIKDAEGRYQLVFALPKRGKEREVPLSDTLSLRLSEQMAKRPPVPVTLPWGRPDGKPRTFRLLFVKADGLPWYRQAFEHTWTAARAAAGAPPPPDENGRFHGLRHTFASIQLAGGADILKLAAWLGHTDPGFTLRTYAHLMPDVRDVGRRAVDDFFGAADRPSALDVPSKSGS
ncbi:Site-specific recombinase XerD [Thermomonospora echinospora]|uniref:Site-specific recombinase XerD n=1 Tax=Thermomonospora echinospora TaxID=1992 RepID=A0A1H6A603_9ACTN|nr:tyrosine-type recombinase/integrase [Thermomonospora echinospora]SEG44173.1 Site-specific recombinase XerD [Thermomonospora echinospora]